MLFASPIKFPKFIRAKKAAKIPKNYNQNRRGSFNSEDQIQFNISKIGITKSKSRQIRI